MIIDINQTNVEGQNDFKISYDGVKVYDAKTPFITPVGILGAEKLSETNVYYPDEQRVKYRTKYNYIKNQIEEFIPLKFLVSGSQKFNQYSVIDENNEEQFLIYFEETAIWKNQYILKHKDKIYKAYSVQDGYTRRVTVYDDEVQFAELVKPNYKIDGKDIYRVFLKDEYKELADLFMMFSLYLDRLEYNSSYLVIRGEEFSYEKSYTKNNKYYDKDWISNNFDANDYFNKIDKNAKNIKDKIKRKTKNILIVIGTGWGIGILIAIIVYFLVIK